MTPVLVSAPDSSPVDLSALKLHCSVESDTDDWDDLLLGLRDAAVGYLDGWTGVLGRSIMPQSWSVEAVGAGCILLPMPDVTEASADYGAGSVELTVVASEAGPTVEVVAAGTITFSCAMPAPKLAVAVLIIKMLVEHWFRFRGTVNVGALSSEIPMTASSLIQSLRWRRV